MSMYIVRENRFIIDVGNGDVCFPIQLQLSFHMTGTPSFRLPPLASAPSLSSPWILFPLLHLFTPFPPLTLTPGLLRRLPLPRPLPFVPPPPHRPLHLSISNPQLQIPSPRLIKHRRLGSPSRICRSSQLLQVTLALNILYLFRQRRGSRASAAQPLVPARGDFDIGVGYFGVVLEDAARTCECEAGLEVPECISVKVRACNCVSVMWVK